MPHAVEVDVDRIRVLYCEEHLTYREVASQLGVGYDVVASRCKKFGWSRAPSESYRLRAKRRPWFRVQIDDQRARRLYEEGGLSVPEIARVMGCSKQVVRGHLGKFGVKFRCVSEANRLAYQRRPPAPCWGRTF